MRPFQLAFVAAVAFLSVGQAEPRGGIEIGARGVKAVALEIGVTGELKLIWTASENVGLAAGLAERGSFDPQVVAAAAAAVNKFAKQLENQHHIETKSIVIAGSSGLFSALTGDPAKSRQCREQLAAAIKHETGRDILFVSETAEAELGIAAAIPPAHAAEAMHIDIGSGNTKGGYRADTGYFTFSIPFGTTTFHDRIKKLGGDFSTQARALGHSEISPALKARLTRAPGIVDRPRVYLSGGAVWAVATLLRPADRSAYTPLKADDFTQVERILQGADDVPSPDLAGIADKATRKAAEKDVGSVRKIFTRDQLLAASQILQAITAALGEGKELTFVRDAHVGWIAALIRERATK